MQIDHRVNNLVKWYKSKVLRNQDEEDKILIPLTL